MQAYTTFYQVAVKIRAELRDRDRLARKKHDEVKVGAAKATERELKEAQAEAKALKTELNRLHAESLNHKNQLPKAQNEVAEARALIQEFEKMGKEGRQL